MTSTVLETAIAAWDGESADDIRAIHTANFPQQAYIEALFDLLASGRQVTGVTWLLKAAIEAGFRPSEEQATIVCESVQCLDRWEAVLHVLQCMEYFPVPGEQKDSMHKFLRSRLTDDKKFVRAWAYSGFFFLARKYPEYQSEATQLFEVAQRDEAASVKARVRKMAKLGFH